MNTDATILLVCLLYYLHTLTQPTFLSFFFFFNDTATTEIYTLSLHDALPISPQVGRQQHDAGLRVERARRADPHARDLLAARLLDGRACQLHDPFDHGLRALLRDGGRRNEPHQLRAVFGHRADDDVGTADVNPDDVAHRSPRWRAGRPRPRVTSCTSDDPAGSSAVRAPSRDGTTGRRAGPPGHAVRAARTRTPGRWSRRSPPSACRPPARSAAARCRWSPARRRAG